MATLMINGYLLDKTCSGCPEQYDVYRGDEKVGYLRLRHGHFRASVPNSQGETVYSASTKGDGSFNDEERESHLRAAVAAIDTHLVRAALREHQ